MKPTVASALILALFTPQLKAMDVRAEMQRADDFGKKTSSLVSRNLVRTYWASDGSHLIYQVNPSKDEVQYFKVDPKTGGKTLLETGGGKIAEQLPQQPVTLLAPEELRGRRSRSGPPSEITIENGTAGEVELFWVGGEDDRTSYGKIPAGESSTRQTYAGHIWLVARATGEPLAAVETGDTPTFAKVTSRIPAPQHDPEGLSPDRKWIAFSRDHNLFLKPANGGDAVSITSDGSPNHEYSGPITWSPDSTKLVAFQTKSVKTRKIRIVQSSPEDQLQPKLQTIDYPKPGDAIPQPMPRLIDINNRREIPIDPAMFSNPWAISDVSWTHDSSGFSFVYNQRGHQVMRIIGVRADTGSPRVIFEDTSKTFIDYSQKQFIHHLPNTGEILWASERDGYNHLYLIDQSSGQIKNPVTHGNWNVREVVNVDSGKRQLLLKVMGMPGQNPYQTHYARVNFDGTGFTRLTQSDGNHSVEFSPDGKFLTDAWSRVDQPPVVELRRADDGSLVTELDRADDSALQKSGWSRPERFVAKGRDGQTDIYGVIIRPLNFDPKKRYPVVEDIYAGPHDFFVPQNYSAWSRLNAMAEMGFIVVKIDGMGTNWRSKAFHDVCWKNLADGGFPDRIAWIKAAAAARPWMDISRVGIYGGSAGGQNSLAALLHHGDFYKVAVSDCGCHDNRMDKIWWNEAWMGWPVDTSYAENSNVTHAAKLSGKLLLIVGELDSNVDPASTTQVVNALQKADTNFEFLPITNAGHGAAETPYGKRRKVEFLLRHLVGEPE
jgi:dipeptidyl-peptidase 4